jgi:hypothetical protein
MILLCTNKPVPPVLSCWFGAIITNLKEQISIPSPILFRTGASAATTAQTAALSEN